MNVDLHEDGGFTIKPTEVGPDDYIDMRAEIDILAAVPAAQPTRHRPMAAGRHRWVSRYSIRRGSVSRRNGRL